MYIYIYVHTPHVYICKSTCVYIYIHIYIYTIRLRRVIAAPPYKLLIQSALNVLLCRCSEKEK